jgi:2,3,4,5-tetrahydropyridine-2-carboxylate N-succinyltransferase
VTATANPDALREAVERLAGLEEPPQGETLEVVVSLLDALEEGHVRAARPTPEGWAVNAWVKRGILLGFRIGANREVAVDPVFHFRDRDTFPTRNPSAGGRDVRIVPGGTTIRRGAFMGEGVVVMPPAYVNVGAWVGEASMVDSHALVGSCAQLGARVHLSAAAQIGGVLEPIGALPVIVEDDVFVGGGCGIYEGTQVRRGAVIGAGVVLTRSVPIFDLDTGQVLRAHGNAPLVVPENAVVVPGSRPARGAFAERHGLQLHAPVIVKYRDPSTDGASALEEALR